MAYAPALPSGSPDATYQSISSALIGANSTAGDLDGVADRPEPPQRNTRVDVVPAALEQTEHTPRIAQVAGLAEHHRVHDDHGVGAEDRGAGHDGSRRQRFLAGETADVGVWLFLGPRRFVDRRGRDRELKSGRFQQLGAPRRRRRQDEVHVKRDDTLDDVKPLTTLADSVLPELLARAPLTPEKIDFAWRLAVGAPVHRACTITLTNGTLAVSVPDRAWAREIERSLDVILVRMQRMLGRETVRRIECRVG